MSPFLIELSVTFTTSIRLVQNVDPFPTSCTYTAVVDVDSSTLHLQAVKTAKGHALHVWVLSKPYLAILEKRVHIIMALNPQIALLDSGVQTLNTLPEKAQQMSASDATLHVFKNFVEQVARVDPGASTMEEKPPIPTTQVRRCQRFLKPVDALKSLPSTAVQPTSSWNTHASSANRPQCTRFIDNEACRILTWKLTLCVTSLRPQCHLCQHVHVTVSPGIVSDYYDVN